MPPAERLQLCHLFFLATGKLALLVGNNHYQHHPNLMAPVTDVFELSLLLKQLGFQVVSLLDLNKAEMVAAVSRFLQLLEKGVYGKAAVYVQVAAVREREEQRFGNFPNSYCIKITIINKLGALLTHFSLCGLGYPCSTVCSGVRLGRNPR